MRITLILIMMLGFAYSQEENTILREALNHKTTLSKSSAITITRYSSSYYNIDFSAPSGWAITKIDSSATQIFLTVSKTGRNDVTVFARRGGTVSEARFFSAWMCHITMQTVAEASSSVGLQYAQDTSFSATSGYSSIAVSYNTSYGITRAYSSGTFSGGTFMFPSQSSFSLYSSEYYSVYSAIYLYSTAIAKGRPKTPEFLVPEYFNIDGRKLSSQFHPNLAHPAIKSKW